ncbi:MAG TPA: hypothetical protein VHC69_02165 [Polyangiaceae bacterium]|nr:hypothetical protein [Polyangiaceae bacterium]
MQLLNNWEVTLPMIEFFERILKGHKRVISFTREQDIFFRIARGGGYSAINALLVNRYTIGIADVMRAQVEFPAITCITAYGSWCGYTRDAKEYGRQHNVGVFIISDMVGALASKVANGYVRKDNNGKPVYEYRSS